MTYKNHSRRVLEYIFLYEFVVAYIFPQITFCATEVSNHPNNYFYRHMYYNNIIK